MANIQPSCLYTWSITHIYYKTHTLNYVTKGREIRDTKTLNSSRNIVSLNVLVDVSRFSPCALNLSRNICCRLKKFVPQSRARVYFVQQILALLLVFHQTHNLASNKFARALATQPIRVLHFFDQQQMFLVADQVDHAR